MPTNDSGIGILEVDFPARHAISGSGINANTTWRKINFSKFFIVSPLLSHFCLGKKIQARKLNFPLAMTNLNFYDFDQPEEFPLITQLNVV
jgi:hypothetical protein